MKAVVLNTCDSWKTFSSFKLIGVFTNRKKLEKVIRKLIKSNDIEVDENSPIELPLKNFTINELNNHINFLSVQEINLNEEC
jgi:hypothetical protein